MYKSDIQIYLTGQISPFNEISGNRPVLFNTDRATSFEEFENYVDKLMKQLRFKQVKDNKFQFKRDGIMNAVINLDSEVYNSLKYNYCIVKIRNNDNVDYPNIGDVRETLLYFVEKVEPIQNNVNRLYLKLDVISTYFWKISKEALVLVDRLNYNIGANNELLLETLKVKDDSIGNIIKDRKIIPKPKAPLEIRSYSYRNLTTNQIEKMKNVKTIDYTDGIVTTYVNTNKYGLENASNEILYSVARPHIKRWIFSDTEGTHRFNFDSYQFLGVTDEAVKNDTPGWLLALPFTGIIGQITYSIIYSQLGTSYTSTFNFSFECLEHRDEVTGQPKRETHQIKINTLDRWTLTMDVASLNKYELFYGVVDVYNFIITHRDSKDKEKELQTKDIPIIMPEIVSYDKISYNFPDIFNKIPPIPELVDIDLYSWTGTNIPLTYFNVKDTNIVDIIKYSKFTKFEEKTYISKSKGINIIDGSQIDNKEELSNTISIAQRVDSKEEYLAANSNQIEMEKKIAKDNAILGGVKSGFDFISNSGQAAAKGLFGDIAGAVASGGKALGNVVDFAGSIVNYQNKVNMIDARIQDIGNKRSQYGGGETGDVNLLYKDSNVKYFDDNGLNIVVKLPSGRLYERLKYHYRKFGCKLNVYMNIKECFDNTEHENFTYIKLNDTSNLYSYFPNIPNEVLPWINDILISGIHFWKNTLPFFTTPEKRNTVYNNIYFYDGVNELKETNTLEY